MFRMLSRSSRASGRYRSELEDALNGPEAYEVTAAGPAVSESQVSFSGSYLQPSSLLGPVYHVASTNPAGYATSHSATALSLSSSMYPAESPQHFHVQYDLENMDSGEGIQDVGSSIEENRALAFNSNGWMQNQVQPACYIPFEPILQNPYRPQSNFNAYTVVHFSVDDQPGIMLADALNGCKRLSRRDDLVFTENTAQKMSLRILLLGYPEYDRQVIVRNLKTHPESITVGKLAQIAAKEFYRMLEKQAEKGYHLSFSPDDVVLLGVDRVAKGSIQPRFGIIRPQVS